MASPPILCSILRQIVASEKRTIRADQLIGSRSRSRRRQPCAGTSALLLQGREADQEYCTKVDSLLYAGNNLEKGPRDFRAGHQASAEDQAGHSAADAHAGAVAEAGVAHAWPLHSQDVEAEQRLSRLSKAFRRGRSSRTLFSLGNSGTYLCVLRGFRPLHYGGSARRQ